MVAAAKWMCTTLPYRLLMGRVVLPWASGELHAAGEALEIGTGSGAMAAQLLAQYPELTLVATDYDAGMVAHATKSLSAFADRATVQRADAAQLPFDDDRFDLVLSFAMLHHVGDWPGAVREALRVLRPGGRFVGYDALDALPVRLLHCGEGDNVRLMRRGATRSRVGWSARRYGADPQFMHWPGRALQRHQDDLNATSSIQLGGAARLAVVISRGDGAGAAARVGRAQRVARR
jgi:SAM-dependent methyltransferase